MALSGLKKQKRKPIETPDSDGSDGHETDDSGDASAPEGNAGWADSIAKVLNTTKPKTKKTLVLSRAKKHKPATGGKDAKSKDKDYGFEIDGEAIPEEEEEKPDTAALDEQVKSRKNMPLQLRSKPTWKDIERERTLRKVATRGVVQLFNAVRIQQKDIQHQLDEAGPLDSRKDAVLNNIDKRKFLDVLMSGSRSQSEAVDNPVKRELKNEADSSEDDDANDASSNNKKKSEWNVLREDFMTNKKLKHWDEEEQENENSEADDSGEESEEDDDN